MTQPWDFRHAPGGSGLTLPFSANEQQMAAGNVSSPDSLAPSWLAVRPIMIGDNGAVVSKIGISLFGTGMFGTLRAGIYACPPPSSHDMYPAELIIDGGEVSLNGTNKPQVTFTPTSLSPGFHYIATLINWTTNTGPSGYSQSTLGGPGWPLGYSVTDRVGYVGFGVQYPYGPLPSTFPTALPAGAYNFLIYNTSGICIYVESTNSLPTPLMTVTTAYNAGTPAGTAVVATDTTTAVSVNYGSNTSPATVASALQSATNIATATSLSVAALMPNFGSTNRVLHPAGPLRIDRFQTPILLPVSSIEVEP